MSFLLPSPSIPFPRSAMEGSDAAAEEDRELCRQAFRAFDKKDTGGVHKKVSEEEANENGERREETRDRKKGGIRMLSDCD